MKKSKKKGRAKTMKQAFKEKNNNKKVRLPRLPHGFLLQIAPYLDRATQESIAATSKYYYNAMKNSNTIIKDWPLRDLFIGQANVLLFSKNFQRLAAIRAGYREKDSVVLWDVHVGKLGHVDWCGYPFDGRTGNLKPSFSPSGRLFVVGGVSERTGRNDGSVRVCYLPPPEATTKMQNMQQQQGDKVRFSTHQLVDTGTIQTLTFVNDETLCYVEGNGDDIKVRRILFKKLMKETTAPFCSPSHSW